ncbi:MAG TPA: hypothetical protein VJY34_08830 [Roseiarcus sp.]|nr:hypothetical protein [Roseiarcus sp.]
MKLVNTGLSGDGKFFNPRLYEPPEEELPPPAPDAADLGGESVTRESEKATRPAPVKRATREKKVRSAPDPNDPRPTIRLAANDIERIVDEAEAALIQAKRGLYQRNSLIVAVGFEQAIAADESEIMIQRIFERGEHALLEDLSSAAHFERYDARRDGYVTTSPPMWIVKTLKERKGKLRFPILTGVVNVPTIRADGSLLVTPGYDQRTGLLFDPLGVTFPPIPDRPTRDDALDSLALLNGLIGGFPFVADRHRAVALSAILTALSRRSLASAPLHAFSAPEAGSGKSLLVDTASTLATGEVAPVTAQGANEEELEKRLVSWPGSPPSRSTIAGAPSAATFCVKC